MGQYTPSPHDLQNHVRRIPAGSHVSGKSTDSLELRRGK